MMFSIGNLNESGDRAAQVEQGVHLYRSLLLAKVRPRKDREAEINRGGVQCVHGGVEVDAERVGRIHRTSDMNRRLREVGVDAPIAGLHWRPPKWTAQCTRGIRGDKASPARNAGRLRCRADSREKSIARNSCTKTDPGRKNRAICNRLRSAPRIFGIRGRAGVPSLGRRPACLCTCPIVFARSEWQLDSKTARKKSKSKNLQTGSIHQIKRGLLGLTGTVTGQL